MTTEFLCESIVCAEQEWLCRSCFTPPHPAQQCLYELELDDEFQFCSVKGSKWDLGGGGDLIRKEMGEVRGDKAGLQFEWKLEWRRGEKQCKFPSGWNAKIVCGICHSHPSSSQILHQVCSSHSLDRVKL